MNHTDEIQKRVEEAAELLRKRKNRDRQRAYRAKWKAQKAIDALKGQKATVDTAKSATNSEWFAQAHAQADAANQAMDVAAHYQRQFERLEADFLYALTDATDHQNGREIALAKTNLQQAVMWALKATGKR